jgi:hypothetical protein
MRRVSVVLDGGLLTWVVAALAAASLILALSAPSAFGQNANSVEQEIEQEAEVENSICTNVNQVASNQYNAGDQNVNARANAIAVAGRDGNSDANAEAAAAAIANELGVSVVQVNECLNDAADNGNGPPPPDEETTDEETTDEETTVEETTDEETTEEESTVEATEEAIVRRGETIIAKSIPEGKVLANTGGPASVFGIVGCVLLGGGLLLGGAIRRR